MAIKGGQYVSPMQLGIIHRESFLGRMSRYMYPVESPTETPWEIISTQEWDFGIRMYQNIIVKEGNTLTIKCEVQMPPDGKIIVEKGAKLVLDGGTITSYHPKATWRGIELFGDKNAAPIATNQGSLEMKNESMIEYAMDGVRDFFDNVWSGGGIIQASNSTFKDCRRAVELNDYPNFARGSSCFFSNIKFVTVNPDAPSNLTGDETGQVTVYNERGVLLTNCTFENRLHFADIKEGKYGIYTCDAGFRVQDCSFKGYKTGVATTTVYNHPGRTAKVMGSTFDSLSTGLLFANNFSYAQDNVFDNLMGYVYNSGMMAYYRNGEAAYVDNASGISLTRNTVHNSGSLVQRGFTSNDSRVYGTRFIDNIFNDIGIGVVTQRRNPTLDILCNHFNGGSTNIAVNPQSTHTMFTLKDQGNGCDDNLHYRAGNTFNDNTSIHIASYLSTPWRYYYKTALSNTIPVNLLGTSVNAISCEGSELNSRCNLATNVESWVDQHFDEAYTSWPSLSPASQASTYGLLQLSGIIARLNERGSSDSLSAFLAAVGTNDSRKLLLPLLLEAHNYVDFDGTLNALVWHDTFEQQSFNQYFLLLKNIQQSGRQLSQLSSMEKNILQTIAEDSFEHSAYARSWLQWAFNTSYDRYQEQLPFIASSPLLPSAEQVEKTRLFEAVPNPSGGKTTIRVTVKDAETSNAILKVFDMRGNLVYSKHLDVGLNEIPIELEGLAAGTYTYSLIIKGKTLESKRLVVTK